MADSTDALFHEIAVKARETNAHRDTTDRAHGWSPPHTHGAADGIRTAMSAIECGVKLWIQGVGKAECMACIMEGYAMLEVEAGRASAEVN